MSLFGRLSPFVGPVNNPYYSYVERQVIGEPGQSNGKIIEREGGVKLPAAEEGKPTTKIFFAKRTRESIFRGEHI
jgi:hypothetical protein